MDNQNTQPKENNKKLIIIASIAIAGFVALFIVLGLFVFNWFGTGKSANNSTAAQPAETIKVVETKGSEVKTKKLNINVRDVKFKDSIKKVKKFEKGQKDTIDNPSEASTKDGYTYLTYLYDPSNAKFFGVKPADSKTGALLQYVFKNKKLFDIRIQFGDISEKDREKLEKNLTDKYGKPTHTVKYSNDSYKKSWRTQAKDVNKQTILTLNYSANSGTTVSYESFSR